MAAFGPSGSNGLPPGMVEIPVSTITLNNTDTVKFIQLYQQQELLWNAHLPDHQIKVRRSQCLMKISHLMGHSWTEQQVKDKIVSLRSRYSKEIVKVRVSMATGADHYAPVWRFFPLLDSFLRPFCTTRKTNTRVVRDFHKRLMEGRGQTSNTSPSKVTPGPTGSAAPSPTFHSPLHSDNAYYGNYQYNSIDAHREGDDDDDVQIVDGMNAEGWTEEGALYIDDDNENSYSNGRGGSQEGIEGSFGSYASNDRSGRQDLNQSISRGVSESGFCNVAQQKPGRAASEADDVQMHNCEETLLTVLERISGTTTAEVGSRRMPVHRNKDGSSAGTGHCPVKTEKLASPPSPPPPPLPQKQRVHSAAVCSTSQSGDVNLAQASTSRQLGSDQTDVYSLDLAEAFMCKDTASTLVSSAVDEPVRKKIKQEKEQSSDCKTKADSLLNGVNSCVEEGHFSKGTTRNQNNFATGTTTQTNLVNSNQTNVASTFQSSNAKAKHSTSNWTEVAGQITNQVTSAMTSQMTDLLQALVTQLVGKSSLATGIDTDTELAYVNHMVCELRKLDEDLLADAKLNIQKVIHEAQKEMRQRRTDTHQSPGGTT